ncbi:hypothetical protein Aeqsu_2567 [Aequorivita sublithincola DSM 14238]|uniref:Uncharacterized protein n=1 Tax=Aequorivita sublithincola (strain DSM 14238 / LMG 21431 / ACAM 643 / 9-3) TaxID=746697 RepID=I3YYF4_AEQSU|nr:hypothetical protein Aeqsu_2567 [Aequorivita sublithincola DSM 14238]
MELSDFLFFILPIFILEVSAALAGSHYLKKTIPRSRSTRHFVYFLWFTVFVEFIGSYAPIAYFSDYRYFTFIKGTPFENNFWWYQIYILVSFSFLVLYFISFLKNTLLKRLFALLVVGFIISSVIIYIYTDGFFKSTSQYASITGTLLLFFSVILFYFELLKSNLLLQLKRFLPFYLSVGVLAFNLCVTPVEIFSEYFNLEGGNNLFVKLRVNVLLYANIFMYAIFIVGFLICSRKKKSSY